MILTAHQQKCKKRGLTTIVGDVTIIGDNTFFQQLTGKKTLFGVDKSASNKK